MPRTAFVFGPEEARSYIASSLRVEQTTTLSPIAHLMLGEAGIVSTTSDLVYSDRSHARVNARLRNARAKLRTLLAEQKIDSAAAEIFMVLTSEVAASGAAMWELLRGTGPWCIYDGALWQDFSAREEAHRALVNRMANEYLSRKKNRYRAPPMPLGWAARFVFSIAARAARPREVVVLHELRRGLDRLMLQIETGEHLGVLTIGYAPKSWRTFVKHALDLVRGRRGGLALLPPLRMDRATRVAIAELIHVYRADPVVARALEGFSTLIAESCAQVAAMNADVGAALRQLRARSVVVWDSSSPKTIAFAHAGRSAGAKVFVAAHATASMHCEAAGRPFAEFRAAAMTGGDAVDVIIAQSPTMAATARLAAPTLPQISAMSILWRNPPAHVPTAATEPALFLWAGNFGRWSKHRPWIEETPDEMVAALARFAEAIIDAPSTRLEVRIKPNWRVKGDVNLDVLRRRVPKHDRILITADGSFGESLSRATAVVTHASTAFEEGLRARVPIVLWGARGRTYFVPGRTQPPAGNSRAAVYAPAWNGDLSAFLTAVADAHRDQPLSDAELHGLVWTNGAATLREIAAAVAHPETLRIAVA